MTNFGAGPTQKIDESYPRAQTILLNCVNCVFLYIRKFSITSFDALFNTLYSLSITLFNSSGGLSLSFFLSLVRARLTALFIALFNALSFALFNPCLLSLSYVKFLRRNSKIFSPPFVSLCETKKERANQLSLFLFFSPRLRLRLLLRLCKP